MKKFEHVLVLVARVGFVILFLPSGIGKLLSLGSTAGFIASKGLPAPLFFAGAAGAMEVVCALAILVGWRAQWAALVLAVFTLLAALLFHDFWNAEVQQAMFQRLSFFKNVGIAGGLCALAACGSGRYSLEGSSSRRKSSL